MDHKYEASKFLSSALSPGVLEVLPSHCVPVTMLGNWAGCASVWQRGKKKDISSSWAYKNSSNKVSGSLRKRLFVNWFLSQTRRGVEI